MLLGHVAHADNVVPVLGDDDGRELVGGRELAPRAHRELPPLALHAAARDLRVLDPDRPLEVRGLHPAARHALRIEPDAHRVPALAADEDRADAGEPLETLLQHQLAGLGQVEPAVPVARERDKARRVAGYDYVGEFVAFDPVTGKRAWTYRSPGGEAMTASALATAGGIVFGGTVDREFFALDSATGQLLWRTRLNGDISGSPIAFQVSGRQYVAIAAGGKPGPSTSFAGLTNVRLSQGSAALHVFALPDPRDLQPPGRSGAPPTPVERSGVAASPAPAGSGRGASAVPASAGPGLFTAAQAARGQEVFSRSCANCHRVADQTGAAFRAKWASGGLGSLFNVISRTMPVNAAGSLSKADYAAIIAFMLGESGYPAGPSELPADPDALAKAQLPSR